MVCVLSCLQLSAPTLCSNTTSACEHVRKQAVQDTGQTLAVRMTDVWVAAVGTCVQEHAL